MDCRIAGGRIADIGPRLKPAAHDAVLAADSGALIAGLADHHIHLTALAAWRASVDVTDAPAETLASTVRSAAPDAAGWIRVVGYDDTAHGDLSRDVIDTWHTTTPVRIQHRSGALWVLNSAGLACVDAENGAHPSIERDATGRATGRLWRADDWLRARLPANPPSLRDVGHELASYGITHLADATPDPDGATAKLISAAIEHGDLAQHVAIMSSQPQETHHPRLTLGPVKLIAADHQLPDFDEFTTDIRTAHAQRRPVAVHCVSRQALAFTLAALDNAGSRDGDRIEHCAVTDLATARILAQRGLRVVTQPTLVSRRGDSYRHRVDETELPDLWRYASLLRAGIRVAPSSDAPYGDPDPWSCLRAAASRRTVSGHILGPGERVTTNVALAGIQSPLNNPGGDPPTLHRGAPADLTLLDRPLDAVLREPDSDCVRATIISGQLAFYRDG